MSLAGLALAVFFHLALFSYGLYVLITLIIMTVFSWFKTGHLYSAVGMLVESSVLAPLYFLIMFTLILVGLLKLTGHFSKKNAMYPDAMYPDAMYPESRARGRYR